MENKIKDLHNTLDKFTKGRDNLNLILGSQMVSYNKFGLIYEPTINAKSFSKICHANSTTKCNMVRCKYCNKNDHVTLFCFVRKSHESKNVCLLFHSFKEYHKNKMINMSSSYYFNDYDSS